MNKIIIAFVFLLTLACSVSTAAPLASTAGKFPSTATAIVPTVTAQPVNTPQNAHSAIVANSGGLNVRICAGTDCAVILTLPDNSEVIVFGLPTVLKDGSKWVQVRYIDVDVSGWVNSRYLEAIQ